MTQLVVDVLPELAILHIKEATVVILAEDTVLKSVFSSQSGLPHLLAVWRPAERLHGLENLISIYINKVMNSEWMKILIMDELSL